MGGGAEVDVGEGLDERLRVAGRQAGGGSGFAGQVGAAPREHLPGLTQPVVGELPRLLLAPAQTAQGAEHVQAQVIFTANLDLRALEQAPGAPTEAQQHCHVVVQAAARHEGAQLGANGQDIQTGNVPQQVLGVAADVAQRPGDAAAGRIGAPARLFVAQLVLRQPALVVGHRHLAQRAQRPAADHRPRLTDHRVAAVVVGDGKNHAALTGQRQQFLGLRYGMHQRLVADDVEARVHEGPRHREVQVIGRDDAHGVDGVGPPLFARQHGFPGVVSAFRGQAQRRPGSPGALRRAGQCPGHQLELPVERGGVAMHGPDEGALTAADHAQAQRAPC